MITVAIAADHDDKKFGYTLNQIFSRYFALQKEQGLSHSFVVKDFDSLCSGGEVPEALLIIYKNICTIKKEKIPSQALAVVDSTNRELVHFVSKTKLPAITCGMASMDTITLSSITEESAVINLQRTITCLDGQLVEPQEIPIKLHSAAGKYAIMAAAAALIASGCLDILTSGGL
ncbi:hypothetical protein U6B65_06820 [Oscillospiraceae bacterium MB08-C2-2]|nr:hypothetical protein U6B65_06820 [Oscillospiraceae bacterium MB08-C2-2]